MSSKPDRRSSQEDFEDNNKDNPGQGRQQGSQNQPGKQRKDESNEPANRGNQPRGGQNR